MLKVILVALCANLLYTNANLMIEATATLRPWAAVLMVGFALTYSLISTLAIFRVKSAAAVSAFALLDGFAVYTHLAPHGDTFPATVAAYFGIYTTYTLCVCFYIRKDETPGTNGDKVEGHDAAYWYKCFLYQKQRAEGDKNPVSEIAETPPPPQPIVAAQPTAALGAPRISDDNNDDAKIILSVKRAFARMTDPDRRRERIKDLPEDIKKQIIEMYAL